MPAKDRYHDTVKRALVKDGWTVTKEQFRLNIGERNLWIDMRIAHVSLNAMVLLEVKMLDDSGSVIEELANAVGKYILYRVTLQRIGDQTPLYLAVPSSAYDGILSEELGRRVIDHIGLLLVVFDPEQEEIEQWIPSL